MFAFEIAMKNGKCNSTLEIYIKQSLASQRRKIRATYCYKVKEKACED